MEKLEKIEQMRRAVRLLEEVLENSMNEKSGVVGSFYNFLCVGIGSIKNSIRKLEKTD